MAPALAADLGKALAAKIEDLFASIKRTISDEFQRLVRSVHTMMEGFVAGDPAHLNELDALKASRQYNRFCVIVLAALHRAAEKQQLASIAEIFSDYEKSGSISMRSILELAQLPSGNLGSQSDEPGSDLVELAGLSPLTSPLKKQRTATGASNGASPANEVSWRIQPHRSPPLPAVAPLPVPPHHNSNTVTAMAVDGDGGGLNAHLANATEGHTGIEEI